MKPKLHITMKELFCKQVIIPMNNNNKTKFILDSSFHIAIINRALKNIKSEIKADFVWSEQSDIIIITNKVAIQLDLQTIEQYVKSVNYIKAEKVKTSHLSQLKFYLKIICIPYLLENTNSSITVDVVKAIIKNNHIFNNVIIASRSKVIKVFPKSDMAIIWLDIWNVQSGSKTKELINRYFNVGSYIATIRETNINPGVPQCKNCWKWGYTTFSCRIQGSKCIKYNSSHKTEYHRHYV